MRTFNGSDIQSFFISPLENLVLWAKSEIFGFAWKLIKAG